MTQKYIQARIQAQLAEVARNRFKDVPAEVLERAQQKALKVPLQLEHLLKQPEQASRGLKGIPQGTGASAILCSSPSLTCCYADCFRRHGDFKCRSCQHGH